jgi:hypothetical protein
MKLKHLKKLMLGILFLCLSILAIPAGAQVNIQVGIQMPPLIVFSSPPEMVVLPETYVYVVPDIDEDIFFYHGYWWRPWRGHWYRSRYYDRGWSYYKNVPTFYREVPQDWRHYYGNHDWRGNPWQYQRIPQPQVQKNWSSWEQNKYWQKQQTWGVQGLNPQKYGQPQAQHQQPQARQQPMRQPNNVQLNGSNGNQKFQSQQPQARQPERQVQQKQQPQTQHQQPQAQQKQPQAQKQQPQTRQPERQVQQQQQPQTQHQQPQAQQQPNKGQVNQGQGNQGQGNKEEKQQGGEKGNKDKGNK